MEKRSYFGFGGLILPFELVWFVGIGVVKAQIGTKCSLGSAEV